MAKSKVEVGAIVGMALGVFILFTILNAIYGTVNTAVSELNVTMTTGGNLGGGNLVVTGWTIFQYLFGLGVLILAGAWLVKKAQSI